MDGFKGKSVLETVGFTSNMLKKISQNDPFWAHCLLWVHGSCNLMQRLRLPVIRATRHFHTPKRPSNGNHVQDGAPEL